MASPHTPASAPSQALAQHASMLGYVARLLAVVVRDDAEESAALARAATRLRALGQASPATLAPRDALAAVRDASLLAERTLARLAQSATGSESARLARSVFERLAAQQEIVAWLALANGAEG